jgi:hypothetical protein
MAQGQHYLKVKHLSSKVYPNVGVRYEALTDDGRFDKALAGTACGASVDALLAGETEVLEQSCFTETLSTAEGTFRSRQHNN